MITNQQDSEKKRINLQTISIPDETMEKWQQLVDALVKILDFPVGLIMKVDRPEIEVFVASDTPNNPYKSGDREEIYGLYCEEVINSKQALEVQNALKSERWRDNPDIELGMIHYLGYPIQWPTGEPFGTICVLDRQERPIDQQAKLLLQEFKAVIDAHLELIYKKQHLKQQLEELQATQEIVQAQRDFLQLLTTTIRHDLNNNITLLHGNVRLLTADNIEDKKDRLLQITAHTAKTIKQMTKLEQIIDATQPLKNTDVASLIRKVHQVQFKALQLSVTGSLEVLADGFLELLFSELFRNVVKHTAQNRVDIELNEDERCIRIIDYGPGIPQDLRKTIFDTKDHNQAVSGLLISRLIMERYHGSIEYEEGKGEQGAILELHFPDDN